MSTADLPGSSRLAGRYRLVERLGAGGMSVVWRGFDEVLGRQVAVKVLPPSSSADPAFRRRLRQEAQAAARLAHPNITSVYDYGEATTPDGEPVPYVVMELVDGKSLAAVLAVSRRLPWPAAVRVCSEVAAGLAAAHHRGIVHRDVTPANVMLTAAGAKVVDFGISALIGENDIDPDGSLLGTPAYLAPERLAGGQVSAATDVYAVGLLIYRTLTGDLPWDAGTTTALLRAHQYVEPEPLPPVEGLPAPVAALIGRCLRKHPDDRPGSAEVARVLASASPAGGAYVPDGDSSGDTFILASARQHTDRLAVQIRPASGPAQPALSPPAAAPVPPPETGRAGPRPGGRVLLVAGAAVCLGLGAYGFSATGSPGRDDTAGGGPAVVAPTGRCVISYTVWADDGSRFKASVSVANRDVAPVKRWKLWFVLPGDQVLSAKVPLHQANGAVTVISATTLRPQATQTMQLSGRYRESNATPQVFQLDGKTCETYVSGKPGQPSQPVQHLSDGSTRIGPAPTSPTPVPGLSTKPDGVVVPVSVPATTPAPEVTPDVSADLAAGGKGHPPRDGDATISAVAEDTPETTPPTTSKVPVPDPPNEGQADIPATRTTRSSQPTTNVAPTGLPAPSAEDG